MSPSSSQQHDGVGSRRVLTPEEHLEAVIDPVVTAMGYELVCVEWSSSGKQRMLRVYIDREGGVNMGDCARMSPIVSSTLDAAEEDATGNTEISRLLAGAYTLEVSSPGLDRPLAKLSHFGRFVGSKATIKVTEALDPETRQRTFHGRIVAAQPDTDHPQDERQGAVLLRGEDDGVTHTIPLALIRRAHLVYEGP